VRSKISWSSDHDKKTGCEKQVRELKSFKGNRKASIFYFTIHPRNKINSLTPNFIPSQPDIPLYFKKILFPTGIEKNSDLKVDPK